LKTIPEISRIESRGQKILTFRLRRLITGLVRAGLFIFSIPYFMYRIWRTEAKLFIANNGGYPGGLYCISASIAASFVPGCRVFHVIHSQASQTSHRIQAFQYFMDYLIDSRCEVITLCEALRDRLLEVRRFRRKPAVIPNGISDDVTRRTRTDRDGLFTIVNIGYFDENKNQRMLLKVTAELITKYGYELELILIGQETADGSFRECVALAADLGISDSVRFVEFENEPQKIFRDADLLVSCSRVEGLPLNVIEAMRAGLPVIATRAGGVDDLIVHGATGYLVDIDDDQALLKMMKKVFDDPVKLESFGICGRQRYESFFTEKKMIERYTEILYPEKNSRLR